MKDVSPLRRDALVGLALLAIAIALPFLWPSRYLIGQLTLLFIWATVVSQWNLVFGVAGIFSLAQMAVFAVGGYVTGMLALYLDISLWVGMLLGGLAAVIFSLLVGLACLRLSGAYVALLTLAIAQVMYLLIITDTDCFKRDGVVCLSFTGGSRGLSRFGDFGFRDWLGDDFPLGTYFLALVVLAVATAFSFFIIRGPIGLAFQALRDNAVYATTRGISRFRYQLVVFAASAFFTGLAGGVFAGHFRVMGANTLYLSQMLFLLSMMIVGGVGRAWGPLAGAVLLMLVDEGLKEAVDWRMAGLGLILILFTVVLPKGITGAAETLGERLRRKPR